MFVQTKLDGGNIATIGRVLEIEAHELVFLLLKPFLEQGKKTLDFGAVVHVDDIEFRHAMCEHRTVASDYWRIHGGGLMGKKRGEERETNSGEEWRPSHYCSVSYE
jgi:hypothetical protein